MSGENSYAGLVTPQLLEARADEHPDRVFAIFESGERWTYADTVEQARTFANALAPIGVGAGDVVASMIPNGTEALAAWFGTNTAAATYAPVNTAYKGRLLQHALDTLQPAVLVVHAELWGRFQDLSVPSVRQVVLVGKAASEVTESNVTSWDGFLSGADASALGRTSEVRPWDDATVMFTSGTTGPSKAVRRPYILYEHMARAGFDVPGVTADDRFYVCAPMFHGGGDVPIYSLLRAGGSVVIVEGFQTGTFWDDVRSWSCTVAWVHSAMCIFLNQQPRREDDADNPLRLAMLAPMFPRMHEFCRRFKLQVYSVYGMTELPPVFSVVDPDDYRSLGKPLPEFETRLVDEHDQEVADGGAGELIVRHQTPWALTPGYYRNPEATERLWRNGWLHTGDVFIRSPETGEYSLVDRSKDAIRRRGENVSSHEVEVEALEFERVQEVAAYAVAGDIEDEVMISVVPRPDEDVEPGELHDFMAERLPHFAVPRYIRVTDNLPKTPSLRVSKHELRDRGVSDDTWDALAAGRRLRRERFGDHSRGSTVTLDAPTNASEGA